MHGELENNKDMDNQLDYSEGFFGVQSGLDSVSRTFSGLMVPMAQYVLTKMIKADPPLITSSNNDYTKKAVLTDTPVDVGKTETVIDSITAIYDRKIIKGFMKYDDFSVVAYAKTRKEAKLWQDRFESNLISSNQFRGKNLYAESHNLFFKDIPETNWNDVVLDEKVKKDIRLNTVAFLGDKKLAIAGVNKRGLIMYGPPGTGKTSIVKAVFKELEGKEVSRIYVTADSFKHMRISNLFDIVAYLGPTVLAFEDIDMVGVSRDLHVGSSLLGDLLTNLDGMRKHNNPLVVMASTNKMSMLDEALSNRPCRFDRKIEIGLPNEGNLKNIYMKLLGREIDDRLVKLSKDFTGSHVVEVVNTAKILAASETRDISDVLIEACNIVRDNFFPGSNNAQLKLATQSYIVKRVSKGFNKKASNFSMDNKIKKIIESIMGE